MAASFPQQKPGCRRFFFVSLDDPCENKFKITRVRLSLYFFICLSIICVCHPPSMFAHLGCFFLSRYELHVHLFWLIFSWCPSTRKRHGTIDTARIEKHMLQALEDGSLEEVRAPAPLGNQCKGNQHEVFNFGIIKCHPFWGDQTLR